MAAVIIQGAYEFWIVTGGGKKVRKLLSIPSRKSAPQDNPDDPRLWAKIARRTARADGTKGSAIGIFFKPERADIRDSTDELGIIPVTEFHADGSVVETEYNMDDFNSGDTNTTYANTNLAEASKWYQIGETTPTNGLKLTLGHVGGGSAWLDTYDDSA